MVSTAGPEKVKSQMDTQNRMRWFMKKSQLKHHAETAGIWDSSCWISGRSSRPQKAKSLTVGAIFAMFDTIGQIHILLGCFDMSWYAKPFLLLFLNNVSTAEICTNNGQDDQMGSMEGTYFQNLSKYCQAFRENEDQIACCTSKIPGIGSWSKTQIHFQPAPPNWHVVCGFLLPFSPVVLPRMLQWREEQFQSATCLLHFTYSIAGRLLRDSPTPPSTRSSPPLAKQVSFK
jgi:hypothetical protein